MAVTLVSSFITKAWRDPLIQQLYRDCGEIARQINIEQYFRQVEQIHRRVPIRHLIVSEQLAVSGGRINETAVKIQIDRSELVRLRLLCSYHAYRLNERIDSATNYLTFNYQGLLAQEYRSREDRTAVVDYILIRPMHLWGSIKSVCDHIDIVIKDLDQAGWTLTRIIEVMNNISKERQL